MSTTSHERGGMRQCVVMLPLDLADYIDRAAVASKGALTRSSIVRVLLREAMEARGLQPVATAMLTRPQNKSGRRREA